MKFLDHRPLLGQTCMVHIVLHVGVKKTCYISSLIYNYLLHSWMIILVVHSRWVYNFMGIILEAQVSDIFFAFMHSFQNFVSDFGDFQTLYVRRDCHRESTTFMQMSVWDDIGIHCKSGSSFMGLTVNAEISIWKLGGSTVSSLRTSMLQYGERSCTCIKVKGQIMFIKCESWPVRLSSKVDNVPTICLFVTKLGWYM